jgi:hypothetical protein
MSQHQQIDLFDAQTTEAIVYWLIFSTDIDHRDLPSVPND